MIDSITAQKLSQRLGIDRFSVVREYIQIVFLHEFFSLRGIGQTVFKGGTALRLCFGSNRYSEDLDFSTDLEKKDLDMVVAKAVEGMRKQVPEIEVKDLRTLAGISKRLTVKTNLSTQVLTIKLDFSRREKVFKIKQGLVTTNLPVTSTVLIYYLDAQEILAEKYRAVMNRTKGRDVYDMWYLLHRGVKWDVDLIREKLKYYKEEYDLKELVQKVSGWPVAELDKDIRRFLPQNDRGVVSMLPEMLVEELGKI